MIELTPPHGSIKVKSSYYDLTVSEYNSIRDNIKDYLFIFSVLTGISLDEIPAYDLDEVAPFISFLNEDPREMEPLDFITINNKDFLDVSIFESSWANRITVKDLVLVIEPEDKDSEDEYLLTDIIELVSVYTTKQGKKFDYNKIQETRKVLDSMPVSEVYPFGIFLEKQLIEVCKLERKKLKSKYTADQLQAGIESFDELGVFNTIDMIMKEYGFDQHKALRQEYSFIFNKLLLSNKTSKFEKRYAEILRNKNKHVEN